MRKSRALRRLCMVLPLALVEMATGLAQIKLPGGITVPDPRQPGRRGVPLDPTVQSGRRTPSVAADPDRVCPAVVSWIGTLKNEYPEVDLARTVSDRVQQMAVPLFADNVFQKQFGLSYARLSDTERGDFFRTHIIPCQTSQTYSRQTVVLSILNPPFRPGTVGMGPLAPGQLIPALDRLAAARNMLRADEQELAAMTPSGDAYDRVVSLFAKRKDELARVWPSERARFQSSVKSAEGRFAFAALDAKIQPLMAAPASPQLARELRDTPRTYSVLFAAVPEDKRNAVRSELEERRSAVLRELLPPEKARAESFPATRQGLDDGAEWFEAFGQVFLDAPVLPESAAIAKEYLARRQVVLSRMAPEFRRKIEAAQDAGAVSNVYDDVFRLAADRQTDTYQQVVAARSARAQFLAQRADKAMLAMEQAAEKTALLRGDIVVSSLKVQNLTNASVFRAIYAGDFAHAGIGRTDVVFVDMFGAYLQRFGESCTDNLPQDRVMMTEQYCAQTQHWVNRYGMQTSPDTCAVWSRRPLGVFADPRAFAAKVRLEGAAERNGMRSLLKGLGSRDPAGSAMGQMGNMLSSDLSVTQDLPVLIANNGCASKALIRLQDNLTRFANGDDPLHVAGFSADPAKTIRAQDLDARALADALIRANAAGWLMNRYGSLNSAAIEGQLDPQGRPRHIRAVYEQKGFSTTGSVDIAFVDGVPSCLYFADDPGNCKTPSPSVIQNYENGQFRRKSGR